jgi:hypothetical protein
MKLLSACLILCLAGCATLEKDVAPKAAAAVMTYCATPQAERMLIRENVNARITPNSIAIHCQGDTLAP